MTLAQIQTQTKERLRNNLTVTAILFFTKQSKTHGDKKKPLNK